MAFDDLTIYTDASSTPINNVFNIGRSEGKMKFSTGYINKENISKLKDIIFGDNLFSARYRVSRGFSSCGLCKTLLNTTYKGDTKIIGLSLFLIPSINEGDYFVFPTSIIHLIEEHNYHPPEIFIKSLKAIDLEQRFNASIIMDKL